MAVSADLVADVVAAVQVPKPNFTISGHTATGVGLFAGAQPASRLVLAINRQFSKQPSSCFKTASRLIGWVFNWVLIGY